MDLFLRRRVSNRVISVGITDSVSWPFSWLSECRVLLHPGHEPAGWECLLSGAFLSWLKQKPRHMAGVWLGCDGVRPYGSSYPKSY
jgi:hypothetical protein